MSDKARNMLAGLATSVVFCVKVRNMMLSEYKRQISEWYESEPEPDAFFLELTEFVLEQKEKNELARNNG